LGRLPVKYLLDTNIWLWMVEDCRRVPERIRPFIADPENYPFALSAISVWEVAKKVSLGKLVLSIPVRDWLQHATRSPFIEIAPLSVGISLESTILPGVFHKDPADQIIVATARHHNLILLTSDEKIIDYPYVNTLNP
jgi:PIN domain nuclease of toxin-antitoxin system